MSIPTSVPGAKALRSVYEQFVPLSVRQTARKYAKAVVAGLGSALVLVNLYLPDYSDEAQNLVALILSIATILGVRQVANRDPEAPVGLSD